MDSNLRDRYRFALAVPETSDIFRKKFNAEVIKYSCAYPAKIKELDQMAKAIKHFRAICREFQPDILHANGGHNNTIVAWVLSL